MIEVLSTCKPYKSLTLKTFLGLRIYMVFREFKMSSHLMPSLECCSSIGMTSRIAQEKKGFFRVKDLYGFPRV